MSSVWNEKHIDNLRQREYDAWLGLSLEIARLARIAKGSRQWPPRPAESRLPSGLSELTPRECQVLKCIAGGASTKETAAALGMKFKTAACHRHRIMQKLNVHETSSLVRIAIRSGLVSA